MTYCLGVKVNEGLLLASDSRTNAGVDSVATFHKLFVFHQPGERLIVVMTAGNLAVTQEVITRLQQGLKTDDLSRNLLLVQTLFDATSMVGALLRAVIDRDRAYLQAFGADVSSSFIVGGQIAGDEPRLFLVYPAGNFIESEPATPYFQLGETKYGKPILERVLTPADQSPASREVRAAVVRCDDQGEPVRGPADRRAALPDRQPEHRPPTGDQRRRSLLRPAARRVERRHPWRVRRGSGSAVAGGRRAGGAADGRAQLGRSYADGSLGANSEVLKRTRRICDDEPSGSWPSDPDRG